MSTKVLLVFFLPCGTTRTEGCICVFFPFVTRGVIASIYSPDQVTLYSTHRVQQSASLSSAIGVMFFTRRKKKILLLHSRSEDSGGPSDSLLPCDSLKVKLSIL